jgi:hypothetical protein
VQLVRKPFREDDPSTIKLAVMAPHSGAPIEIGVLDSTISAVLAPLLDLPERIHVSPALVPPSAASSSSSSSSSSSGTSSSPWVTLALEVQLGRVRESSGAERQFWQALASLLEHCTPPSARSTTGLSDFLEQCRRS